VSARWQIYAVLICSIYARSRIERLCNAIVATRLSAYVYVHQTCVKTVFYSSCSNLCSHACAQIFAHIPGSHDISQYVSKRRARDGGTHRVVLQPCAATSVSHNSLPKPSVWVPGREFGYNRFAYNKSMS